MKKYNKSIRIYPILILIVIFFGINYKKVSADVLYSQTVAPTVNSANTQDGANSLGQALGNNLSGVVNSVTLNVYATTTDTINFVVALRSCSDSGYTTGCVYNSYIAGGETKSVNAGYNILTSIFTTNPNYVLDPTRYYYLEFSADSNTGKIHQFGGSASNLYTGGSCQSWNPPFTSCGTVNDFYFSVNGLGTTTYTTTRFTSVTPYNNQIVTNSNVSFQANWFITDEDINALTSLWGLFDGFIRLQVRIEDPIDVTFSCQIHTEDFESEILTSSFSFNFANQNTCNGLSYNRDYKIRWTLAGSNSFNFSKWIISTSTYFTLGSTTNQGQIAQYVATTTANRLRAQAPFDITGCNPFVGEYDLIECIVNLFDPDINRITNQLADEGNELQNSFPLGYITDIVRILSTSTVGTLTPIDANMPNILGLGAHHIELDITNSLDSILNATTGPFLTADANDTRTFYEITSDYWEKIVALAVVLYIIGRLLGSNFKTGIFPEYDESSNSILMKQGLYKDKNGVISKWPGKRFKT